MLADYSPAWDDQQGRLGDNEEVLHTNGDAVRSEGEMEDMGMDARADSWLCLLSLDSHNTSTEAQSAFLDFDLPVDDGNTPDVQTRPLLTRPLKRCRSMGPTGQRKPPLWATPSKQRAVSSDGARAPHDVLHDMDKGGFAFNDLERSGLSLAPVGGAARMPAECGFAAAHSAPIANPWLPDLMARQQQQQQRGVQLGPISQPACFSSLLQDRPAVGRASPALHAVRQQASCPSSTSSYTAMGHATRGMRVGSSPDGLAHMGSLESSAHVSSHEGSVNRDVAMALNTWYSDAAPDVLGYGAPLQGLAQRTPHTMQPVGFMHGAAVPHRPLDDMRAPWQQQHPPRLHQQPPLHLQQQPPPRPQQQPPRPHMMLGGGLQQWPPSSNVRTAPNTHHSARVAVGPSAFGPPQNGHAGQRSFRDVASAGNTWTPFNHNDLAFGYDDFDAY